MFCCCETTPAPQTLERLRFGPKSRRIDQDVTSTRAAKEKETVKPVFHAFEIVVWTEKHDETGVVVAGQMRVVVGTRTVVDARVNVCKAVTVVDG